VTEPSRTLTPPEGVNPFVWIVETARLVRAASYARKQTMGLLRSYMISAQQKQNALEDQHLGN
jgi:hypothetical protein